MDSKTHEEQNTSKAQSRYKAPSRYRSQTATKEVIDLCILLRKLGWSHKQVAEYTGYSETWCRHKFAKETHDFEIMKLAAQKLISSNKECYD